LRRDVAWDDASRPGALLLAIPDLVTLLLLLPAILSLVLLAAHLLREGMLILIPFLLLLLPLLLLRRGWVARLWQVVLVAAALEWARTAVFLAADRAAAGESWLRMVVILAAVALFHLAAATLFETESLHRVYPRRPLY